MRFSLLVPLIVCAVATTVFAGEPDEPLESGYEEQVSVTASRTPIPLDETGNSVTILTREDIEARGYPFVADLLRGLPGLAVSRSGPVGSQTQLRVRGAEANHVLVRIDGVDVSDVFGADEVPFELMTSHDIERIEFARGPQSGLWGSDAVAGVIDIVTRPAGGLADSAYVESGSFGTLVAGGRLGAGSERLRFDAAVSHLESDGTNVSRQGVEDDGTENTTASAGVRWNPAETSFELDVTARHTDSSSDFDDIDFVTTGLPVDADNVTDTTLTAVQATGRWGSGDRWDHRFSVSSSSGDAETTLNGVPDTSTAIDKQAISLQTSRKLGDGQRMTVALDHERRDFEQRGTASFFGDPNQDQDIDNTGLAVEYRYHAADRWAASASIRHDSNSDFDDATTFRITGSYGLAGGQTRLRAAVGTGQKAPTFLERFGFYSDTFVGNPNLRPEESTSFEIGLDRRFGDRASLAVTLFDATLEDEINGFFFDAGAGAFTAVNELGESERRGVEIAFEAPAGERLAFHGSYTYTDSEESGGATELRRPKHMASFAASWRSDGGKVRLHGSLNHTGTQDDLFFPPFPQPSQRVELDSYLLADVNVSVRVARRVELTARVENLLDEEYEDVYGFRASGVGGWVGLRFTSTN